jgi:pimeloyl-ACP methyl ester carboxylesterase
MIQVREYGASGGLVVLLHGGPGAPGYMEPVASELAGSHRVLEPLQRSSGGEPLTVACHVEDLHELLTARSADESPVLVGHSWGAMLALAYAAEHGDIPKAIALIGCGTFDKPARDRMNSILDARMTDDLRRRILQLPEQVRDPDLRMARLGELILPLYSQDLAGTGLGLERCDARGYGESWNDMLRLQAEGVYPAAFDGIDLPVLMIHGARDPHPGKMIREGLEKLLPRLEYRELKKSGHYPWLERADRDEFFTVLREWLGRTMGDRS